MQQADALDPNRSALDVVVVAASLGGRDALERILARLPAEFPAPIVVAHHLAPDSPGYLPRLLRRCARLGVKHAEPDERLAGGTVYIAPATRHLRVTRDGRCALAQGPRVSFACPAADVLFPSAAEAFGARTLGVVLSGRLHDGAAGAVAIRRVGGVVLAQEPVSCRAASMPRAAMRLSAVDVALPPEGLADALVSLVMVPGTLSLFGLDRRRVA
jgi:two-component system chemotaxis response regulator CheB